MQEEVAGAPDGTPEVGHLSVHPVGIGIGNGVIVDKFQRALTREREDTRAGGRGLQASWGHGEQPPPRRQES